MLKVALRDVSYHLGVQVCAHSVALCTALTPREADLVHVLHAGREVVPDAAHGLQRRLVEVGGFPIDHLDHHDAQGPDVHLQHTQGS